MEVKDDELMKSLEERIRDGRSLVDRLKNIEGKIEGVDKLIRKITQEIRFLVKVELTGIIKKEYLQSTNLIHLTAIVERLFISKDPISVMRPFKDGDNARMEVDIVCDSGAQWIKVIARNARALTLISLGNGGYGQKSVLDQADTYLRCANFHPHHYKGPKIIFHFACGVEAPLANRLDQMGIVVEGKIVDAAETLQKRPGEDRLNLETGEDSTSVCHGDAIPRIENSNSKVDSKDIKILNLDVSTLLAYISNMTNGHANFIYREPLLTGQAEWERSRPVKPFLDKLFDGKQLLVCKTAYKNFIDIVNIIGGPAEIARAKELEKRIKIVDDAKEGRIMERLGVGGKIKNRSRLVFATGESTKSITVSANEGFVRAARMQGIECTVVLHEPRSLSEVKEQQAKPLQTS